MDYLKAFLVGGIICKSGLSQEGQVKALQYLHQKNSHELRRLCEEENCDDCPLADGACVLPAAGG